MRGNTLMNLFIIFYQYSKLSLKTMLEYKFDRTFITLAIFFREMISVVVMFLILTRFLHIKDWQLFELFFLYSFLFLSYSLFIFLFAGIRDFDHMIHSGEFDRFLTRPLGLMFQIVASRVDYPATLGHGIVGIILFMFTASNVGIDWNIQNIIYYIIALIGGAIIQASIFMISASFSFWTIRVENLRNLIFFNSRRIAGYPISFYPSIIQKILIFVIPFAFVNYFPAQYYLGKEDIELFWGGYMYLTPFVGIIMFFIVYLFWKMGVRSYSSSGNSMY
ncbi:ABC transporter permease [Chengkuizengella axinellae]|uniref:ABC-2 family transporter protein n=1 Tax=Chengkuizengella axinellae TaxID=3064388 RepID=A0ABT9IYZ2_9BACL|nr:ABC-2 family transporter protein [Chengkuizengella sp. 2205SS18-9]MDP5274591.1 ABC-2 family transporter protein [Chengkuizengella sp. 2205SS18-9]